MIATPPASPGRRIAEVARPAERPERRGSIPVWTWAGVAALLLLTLYSVRQTRRLQGELATLQAEIQAQRGRSQALEKEREVYQQALAILGASGTKEVALKASGKTTVPGVRAYWHAEKGLVLSGQHIPLPAADRTFQLWVVPKKGKPISAGIFRPDAGGRVLLVVVPEAPPTAGAALAISDEPASGSPQPTTTPIWVGPVS